MVVILHSLEDWDLFTSKVDYNNGLIIAIKRKIQRNAVGIGSILHYYLVWISFSMKIHIWLIIPTFYKQAYSVCVKGCSCTKVISIIDVLSAISDERSLLLFRTIARFSFNSESSSEILIGTLHLKSKQYYSRMSQLVKADLVIRRHGKYFLTSFGKLVYDAQTTIEKALVNYWKLKAIDRLENSDHTPGRI